MKLTKAQKEKLIAEKCAALIQQQSHLCVVCSKCNSNMQRDRDVAGVYFWCLCGNRHYPSAVKIPDKKKVLKR